MILDGSALVRRLVMCNFKIDDAIDICWAYAREGKFSELEAFIKEAEVDYADRRQYV